MSLLQCLLAFALAREAEPARERRAVLHCGQSGYGARQMDIIHIHNLRLGAGIGFSPHELGEKQDVIVQLDIGVARQLGGESDSPSDAYNYKPLCKAVIALVEQRRYALVEKMAEEIARLLIVDFDAPYAKVTVEKPGALRRSDGVGISIQRRRGDYARNIAYLALGSNIAPGDNMPAAIALLRRYSTVLALSPVYRSAPQGDPLQAHFLNMAAIVHTRRSPADYKYAVIDRIERELQRQRDPDNINAARTIDIDICLWNEDSLRYGKRGRQIPDPDIARYAHVAVPLADLAPDYIHPGLGKRLRDIADSIAAADLERVAVDFGV